MNVISVTNSFRAESAVCRRIRAQILICGHGYLETTVHSFCLSGVLAEGRRDERIEVKAFTKRRHLLRVCLPECFSLPSLALRVRLSLRERKAAPKPSRNSRAVRLAEFIHAS
jgi:hypothetical protein